MRSLVVILGLAMLVGVFSCSTKHGDLVSSLPILPEITEARLGGEVVNRVELSWTYADDHLMDEDDVYNVYVGLRVVFGASVFDTLSASPAGSTSDTEFSYMNTNLGLPAEDLCDEAGLCDPLYTYTYFRVSAVIDGVETVAGHRVFPEE